MTAFKKINLDREKIPQLIEQIVGSDFSFKQHPTNPTLHIFSFRDALINFYFLADGTTTIQWSLGKDVGLSEKIATYIAENAIYDERKNISHAFPSINKDDFALLIEHLISECDAFMKETQDSGNYELVKIEGRYKDTLTIKYYRNGTLQLQGKPLQAYFAAISFLSTILPLEETIKAQSALYKIDLKTDEIKKELRGRLPLAYDYLDETLKKILSSAISFKKIDIALEDYSALAFPALRGLEGYIKNLFLNKGITITKDGFGAHFYYVAAHNLQYLIPQDSEVINCGKTCAAIEKCYNYLVKHRHGLFHAETFPAASRIIERRAAADEIVDSIFQLIEDTYGTLK